MSTAQKPLQITYEGDVPPSPEQVRVAVGYAGQVAQAKQTIGLAQLARSFDLDDGTQVYVLDLQHVRRVHIVPASPTVQPEFPPVPVQEVLVTEDFYVVGIVSGTAHTGRGEHRAGELYVFHDALDLVGGDASSVGTRELFTKPEASFKVAVERHQKFASFSEKPDETYTQLEYVLPGLYTGAMAPVVQLLLGIGKRLKPDQDYPARWFKRKKQPPDFSDKLHVGNVAEHLIENIDALSSVPDEEKFVETVLRYDYRWNRTHGIVFGTRQVTDKIKAQLSWAPQLAFMYADPDRTREPFLVEVGSRGVYIMPLPRDPMSFFDEARAQYRKVYPGLEKFLPFLGEDEDIFSALGGIPSGDCFPELNKDLQRWVRAGWAVKANISLNDVYQGASFVSSGHGWAFADSGRMATTISMKVDSRGLTVGYCWLLTFDIRQKADLHWNVHGDAVITALGLNEFVDTFKAYLLTNEQLANVLDTAASSGVDAAKKVFDELSVSPWWDVTVTNTVVAQGYVDDIVSPCPSVSVGSAPVNLPYPFGPILSGGGSGGAAGCYARTRNFKVFEPVLGTVISYDFSSLALRTLPSEQRPEINGPIFSTFVGDDLEMLYCYRAWDASVSKETINTRQPCQYTGSYDIGWRSTYNATLGHFYTSSMDLRKDNVSESQHISHVTLKEIGRASFAEVLHWFSRCVSLYKHVFGTSSSVTESFSGGGYSVLTAVQASNNRSAFFIKTVEVKHDTVYARSTSGKEFWGRTGTIIRGSLYHSIMHWWGCAYACNGEPMWKECSREVDPENCFGEDPPDAFFYYTPRNAAPFLQGVGNVFLGSAYYTPEPVAPAYTYSSTPQKTYVTERIYGFGLPEIHCKLLKESVDRDIDTHSPFSYEWDMCSDGSRCMSVPWPVLRNYYGKPFLHLSIDWDVGPVVTFGAVPDLRLFSSDTLFGIVE